MILPNRIEAGVQLARRLTQYAGDEDAMVLALPRGGVPVAYEIARRLKLPLDVFLVRKLGMPGYEELAIGAIADGGLKVVNEATVAAMQVPSSTLDWVAQQEQHELMRRSRAYRDGMPPAHVEDKIVILVDDGLATGASMRVALRALRKQRPKKLVVALPVAPISVYRDLPEADDIVCLLTPEPFYSVGRWYGDFSQTQDEEVRQLLHKAKMHEPAEILQF